MFKKYLMIGLVSLGLMVFMVTQVYAGCCCSPRWCCGCLPGSLLCTAKATGLGAILKECTESQADGDCPAGSLTIFGTVRLQGKKFVEDIAYCSNFNTNDPSTWKDCYIPMLVDCENPDPNTPKKPEGIAVPYNYPYPMQSGGLAFSCDKNGVCKEYITFEPPVPDGACKDNWEYLGSRIVSYIQSGDFCKGGWVCPDGSVPAGGGAQCCKLGTIDPNTGRCAQKDEVLEGRICCGEAGRDSETGDCSTLNIGMINDVEYLWFLGGPTKIFEVCRYVAPDQFYNCSPCVPATWDTSATPARVTSWDCPAN